MNLATKPDFVLKRLAVSIGLSIFFLVVYGGTQTVAAARAHVPSFYFSWEPHVPFAAATIIPYLSIDLFFVFAPFLIRDDRQLWAYARRVVAAVAIAGFFFVVLPLKFAFARPEVQGRVGFVFKQFQRADKPFNQLPSLHIALLLIFGDVFLRNTRGRIRLCLVVWFCLIAASPLLVYQHHVIDLIGGLVLGLVCLHFIPDVSRRRAFEPNRRIGVFYISAACVLTCISLRMGKASWPLWWPILSLALVAVGYVFLGPSVYAKDNGRLPWTTRLLFWPILLGQHASLWWYARRSRPYDAVTGRLWIGRLLSRREAKLARQAGVGAVIDLTCEFDEPSEFRSLPYLNVAALDLTAPTQPQIDQAIAFAGEHEKTSIVYVHCKAGYSRTSVVAAAYLLATCRADTVDQAIALLRRARPSLVVRSEARRAIETFHRRIAPCRSPDQTLIN